MIFTHTSITVVNLDPKWLQKISFGFVSLLLLFHFCFSVFLNNQTLEDKLDCIISTHTKQSIQIGVHFGLNICKFEIYMHWNDISMKNEYWSCACDFLKYATHTRTHTMAIMKLKTVRINYYYIDLKIGICEYCIQVDYIHWNIQIPIWLTSYRIEIDKMFDCSRFPFHCKYLEPFLISLHLNKVNPNYWFQCPLDIVQLKEFRR